MTNVTNNIIVNETITIVHRRNVEFAFAKFECE